MTFESNLALFEYKNPRGAALLSLIDGNLFTVTDSLEQAQKWSDTLELASVDILIVYKATRYAYYVVKDWLSLNPAKQLIFLEDNLYAIHHFLDADTLLENPQVHLYYLENSQEGVEVLKGLAWATFLKNVLFTAYSGADPQVFKEIKERLNYETADIHTVCDEYTNYGIAYFRNFWRNLFLLPGSYLANRLQGVFKQVPAIVVAAGPSLKKQMPLLKSLRNKALIFSGGSSVNALTEAEVLPHFAAGIDPNPLQYMRVRQNLALQVPFFYGMRLLHEACASIAGPRLYIRGGDGYYISGYFEKLAKIGGKILGGGHSISNFLVEIAHSLGCSPIILVGFDLAFGKEKERYAPGIEESHPSSSRDTIDDDVVMWKNHKDEPILTQWKWVQEGLWIEEFSKKHGKKRFINATEGGLGIKGIAHMPLEEVAARHLQGFLDINGLVHTQLEEAGKCTLSLQRIFKGMAAIFDSLTHCIEYIDQLLENLKSSHLDSPDTILLLSNLQKEKAYPYVLEVFDRMRTKFDYYTMLFQSNADRRSKLEIELAANRYFFLKEVSIVNQAIIQKTVLEQQERGADIKDFRPKTTPIWKADGKKTV